VKRHRTLAATGPGNEVAMKQWRYIALHAVAAGAFMFLLQRYALDVPLNTSLLWTLTFGGCAAGLAYMQSNR
jgi:fatty acid desaturase